MDALSILRAARVTLAKPEAWGQGLRFGADRRTCCIAEAIESVSHAGFERQRACRAVMNAAGISKETLSLTDWNDAPERTHAEVLVALNLAIATLRLC